MKIFLLNRYNDLYRDLENQGIRDLLVRLILVNENDAAGYLPGEYYDKVRLFQDNSKANIVKKLRNNKPTANNYVFGR